MKNYFFAADAVRKARLADAGIGFCDLDLDGVAGIVVEEEQIGRALQVLGARKESEVLSSLEGIVLLALRFEAGGAINVPRITAAAAPQPLQYRVEVASWNGDGNKDEKDEFVKIVQEILVPTVRTDVVLSVPHGSTIAPVSDGKFHIWIWSAPAGSRKKSFQSPNKIWGFGVGCRDAGFKPSGQGVPIVDTETGWAVAEIVGDNLYVFHDACHCGGTEEANIFRRLCEEVAVELSASPMEKAERQKRLAEERRRKSREQYVAECSKRFEKTLRGTVQAISDGKNEIARLQQALVKKIREVQGAERKLEQLSACKGGELEKYGREFDKFLAVPKVRDVQVADGVVKVFTDTLNCTDPRTGKLHEIGAFRIEIFTSSGEIRWYNLTRRIDGYKPGMHAPHVFSEGGACLGTMAEIIPELVANYEFSALAMVAIQFVESVNTDDAAGKYISNWPVAEAGKEV